MPRLYKTTADPGPAALCSLFCAFTPRRASLHQLLSTAMHPQPLLISFYEPPPPDSDPEGEHNIARSELRDCLNRGLGEYHYTGQKTHILTLPK